MESMHDFAFTRWLKLLIGGGTLLSEEGGKSRSAHHPESKLLLVYIDTRLELRVQRTESQNDGAKFDEQKDDVKRGRGADRIKEIAALFA